MSKTKKRQKNGRDYFIVDLIKGANKAYIEKDQKKEANKTSSRGKIDLTELDEEGCLQCGFSYKIESGKDEDEIAAMECGYCSVSCMDYT